MNGNKALGDFLRSRRERLAPQALGLVSGRRRRAAGLRREEVAERAGIGVDWYVRLEQGRALRPSPTTVDALARALQLSEPEHAHLRALARPPARPAFQRERVSETLAGLLESLALPAYVTGRRFDILAWNGPAARLFGHFERTGEADRNTLLFLFTDPAARVLFGESWEKDARRLLAQFRAAHDLWAGDPAFEDILQRLMRGSTEFACWWQSHDIAAGGSGEKLLHHPLHGRLRFAYANFQANDDPALRLSIFNPLDRATRQSLAAWSQEG